MYTASTIQVIFINSLKIRQRGPAISELKQSKGGWTALRINLPSLASSNDLPLQFSYSYFKI